MARKMGLPQTRRFEGSLRYMVAAVAVVFSLFYIYTGTFGIYSTHSHRGYYLIFTGILLFLLYPASDSSPQSRPSAVDWFLVALTVFAAGYWIWDTPYRAERMGEPTAMDMVIGGMLIVVSLEMGRRVLGNVLPILALIFMTYAFVGPWLPDIVFAHKGFTLQRILEFMASEVAVFGVVINAYASYVFLFIAFAAFLEEAGGGNFLVQFANALAGRSRGGPAKVAVISSGFVGSMMGSGVANVVATGSFTIPLMKRTGYRPHIAGAVEAAASTGGQFMPPIMGAAAFIIAAITEIPYVEVIAVAAVPAVIYFLSILFFVHIEAAKEGIRLVPADEVPALKAVLKSGGHLLLPAFFMVFVLLRGHSPNLAAVVAIYSIVVVSFLRRETRLTPRRLLDALVLGARNSLVVGATAGVVGLMIGAIMLTGLGIKFSDFIINATGGYLFLTLTLVGVVCYILGMGMTVVAAYVVVSVIAVPALQQLGVPLLASHLIVFWFILTSGVTPPVALAAFAASGIAQSDVNQTAYAALRMSLALLITPYLFAYTNLLEINNFGPMLLTAVSVTLGFLAMVGALQGFLLAPVPPVLRMLLVVSAVLLFTPSLLLRALGFLGLAGVLVSQKWAGRQA